MHNSGVLIYKGPGQVIPKEVLDEALKSYGKCSGWAVAAKEEGEEYSSLTSQVYASPVDREKFDEFHLQMMDFGTAFFFGPDEKDVENVQPYLLVKAPDGTSVMVGFFLGDFVGYADKDKNHTPAYNVAMGYIAPMLQKIFDDAEGDLDVLTKHIQTTNFKLEIERTYQKGGTIMLYDADGNMTVHGIGTVETHDWGWHTSPLAIVEAAAPVVATTKKSRFGGYGSASPVAATEPAKTAAPSATPTTTSVPQVQPKKDAPNKSSRFGGSSVAKPVNQPAAAADHKPPATDTRITGTSKIWIAPNASLSLNKTQKFYIEFTGSYPSNWKEKPAIEVDADLAKRKENKIKNQGIIVDPKVIKDFRTAAVIHNARVAETTAQETDVKGVYKAPSRGSEIAEQRKNVAPEHVGKPVSAEKLPVLTPSDKAKVTAMMNQGTLIKVVDMNSVEVMTPDQINEVEKAFPTFSQSFGWDDQFSITNQWSYEMLCKLCRETPDAAAKLLFDYRLAMLKIKAGVANSEVTKQVLGPDGTPVSSKTAEPTKDAAPPKKGSRFGGYKAA